MSKKPEIIEKEVDGISFEHQTIIYKIIGRSPLIMHAMSSKVRGQLLCPPARKNAAEKASSVKHNPIEEYRDSAYKFGENEDSPTRLYMPGVNFKKSMMTAALDLPEVKKTQIGRLLLVIEDKVPVYGIPKLFMANTRQSGMNRAPDVSTRCIVPEWCCEISIKFLCPMLREPMINQLITLAGFSSGLGDWRPEKGSGSFGCFAPCSDQDLEKFDFLVANEGRDAQTEALENPDCYDLECEELLQVWREYINARGFDKKVAKIA